jgi:hypothetical protein
MHARFMQHVMRAHRLRGPAFSFRVSGFEGTVLGLFTPEGRSFDSPARNRFAFAAGLAGFGPAIAFKVLFYNFCICLH